MKKSLKLMTMLVALSMAVSVAFTGCKKEPASTGTDNTKPSESKVDLTEKVTLKMYINQPALKEDEPAVIEELNKRLEKEFNTVLEVEGTNSDKYNLILSSGQYFDLIFTANWKQYGSNAMKNAFMEITPEMLEKYAPDVKKNTPQEAWNQTLINKKMYMIPGIIEGYNPKIVAIRGDLRKKYNVPEVKSISDLEVYMDAIVKNEKGMTPISMQVVEIPFLQEELYLQKNGYAQAGNDVRSFPWGLYKIKDTSSSKLTNMLEDPEYLTVLKKIREWNEKGYIAKGSLTNTQLGQGGQIANGKAAVLFQNIGTANGLPNNTKETHPDWTYEILDTTFGQSILKESPAGGGVALYAKTKYPERALMVINYLRYNKEANLLAQRGFKGKHWDVAPGQSDENVTVPGPDVAKFGSGFTWGPWRNSQYQSKPDPKSTVPGYTELFNDFGKRASNPPLQGFNFDTTNVKTELTAIQQVYQQYGLPLEGGFVADVDKAFADYKAKLKAAGFDKVFAELQKQADDYLKNLK
jgi:putative aldouronate transport system substrate-binding protein